jgi:hypothetical protein
MSFEAKNAVGNPDFIRLLEQAYSSNIAPVIEASPIYLTLDMEWSISGTYSDETYDYDYNFTKSIPQKNRISIRNGSGVIAQANGLFGDASVEASLDLADTIAYGTDECTFSIIPSITYADEFGGNNYFKYSPLYQALFIAGATYSETEILGTKTLIADSSETDITGLVSMAPPVFGIEPIDEGRWLCEKWFFGTNEVDLTGYTAADWRDLRGTYTFTDTDANGITTTATWIIG